MADPCTVIILPLIRVERGDVDLGRQELRPSSDRRKVTELWRVRLEREQDEICRRDRREQGEGP